MPAGSILEQPSLLVQIVSEVEKLNDTEKNALLLQLRKNEAAKKNRRSNSSNRTEKTEATADDQNYILSEQSKLTDEEKKFLEGFQQSIEWVNKHNAGKIKKIKPFQKLLDEL